MSQEVLQKLAKIFANQQKILNKLAQPAPPEQPKQPSLSSETFEDDYSPSPEDLESDRREAERALLGEENLPPDFHDKLEDYRHKKKQNPFFFHSIENDLEALAEDSESAWDSFGKYFKGWTSDNVRRLLDLL